MIYFSFDISKNRRLSDTLMTQVYCYANVMSLLWYCKTLIFGGNLILAILAVKAKWAKI